MAQTVMVPVALPELTAAALVVEVPELTVDRPQAARLMVVVRQSATTAVARVLRFIVALLGRGWARVLRSCLGSWPTARRGRPFRDNHTTSAEPVRSAESVVPEPWGLRQYVRGGGSRQRGPARTAADEQWSGWGGHSG